MKETTEFLQAIGATTNSAFQAAADGKLGVDDLQYFFDDIFKWQKAVQDLTFAQEAAKSTPATVDNAFSALKSEMGNVPPEVSYDLSNAFKGLYCIYRLAARAGWEAGNAAALAASVKK